MVNRDWAATANLYADEGWAEGSWLRTGDMACLLNCCLEAAGTYSMKMAAGVRGMTVDPKANAILEGYLSSIADHLGGPGAIRRPVMAELRDGVLETFEATVRSSSSPVTAALATIERFGDWPMVISAFGPEMIASEGRRLALRLIGTGPIVGVIWLLALLASHHPLYLAFHEAVSAWIALPLVGVVLTVTIAVGVAAVAGTGGIGLHFNLLRRVGPQAAALTGAGAVVVDITMPTVVIVLALTEPGSLAPVPMLLAVAASLTRLRFTAPATYRYLSARHSMVG